MRTIRILIIAAAILVPGVTSSTMAAPNETQAHLQAQARITQAAAEKTALAKVPNGKIKSSDLEREHGMLIWSFDICKSGAKSITEVQVDAKTGEIVSVRVETPKDQANEAAADKKEKK